ncbi:MAG: serine/threonine protein kinase, partial [Planctomycetota bacterium]
MSESPPPEAERVRSLFAQVFEVPAAGRAALLDGACSDPALRAQVEDLLWHYDQRLSMLSQGGEPAPQSSPSPAPPARIGPYTVIGTLGAGGMGVVYRARQASPQRDVALKVLQLGVVRDDVLARFAREAELLGRLKHPGIAQVFDAGTFDAGHGS